MSASRSSVGSCSGVFSSPGSNTVRVTSKQANRVAKNACPKRVNQSSEGITPSATVSSQTSLIERWRCRRPALRPLPLVQSTSVSCPLHSVFAHAWSRSSRVSKSSLCPCPLTRPESTTSRPLMLTTMRSITEREYVPRGLPVPPLFVRLSSNVAPSWGANPILAPLHLPATVSVIALPSALSYLSQGLEIVSDNLCNLATVSNPLTF
jgi:hypothetical protein